LCAAEFSAFVFSRGAASRSASDVPAFFSEKVYRVSDGSAAGRLSEQKNHKMMIDAVKIVANKYNDVCLRIYGVGELEGQLRSYINELSLENNVKLMGRSYELYNVYKNADLYVMSSNYEGMPNALAEAMAIGLPCISTDCRTGPRDLNDDETNGFLVPCNDANALAEKIKAIFEMSSQEQKRMGEAARVKIINVCGESSSLQKLVELIEIM
jgi:glycosyltransferase involved in cell wall biosynthesis